ncbi:MAG: peptide deformylase [Holosporaceae bacterium]|jgi:peptide deformylase|nr:peptide deformylase [Holosporaceae bacterium]
MTTAMELLEYPHPILSKKCDYVEFGDPTVKDLTAEMVGKLYEWNGAGLAAPQVGVSKRVIVIDTRQEPKTVYVMVNPSILLASEEMVESYEGCLSLPLLRATVLRHSSVVLEYLDAAFERHELEADGFLACCLQHELDHLDGMVYIDRLSRWKRAKAIREYTKLRKMESGFSPGMDEGICI